MLNVKILKNCRGVLSFLLILCLFAAPFLSIKSSATFTPDAEVNSVGAYMVNLDTDICVYKKNETTKCYPASTTKIMTCLLALEMVDDLDKTVKVTYDSTNEFWEGDLNKEGPSSAAIEVGQTGLTYRDCVYALMLASACEAANVLAYNIGGESIENFVSMMNAKAAELGCVNTHFGNPHGLWQEDNYTCAYDMYLIARYAYDTYPEFMTICNTNDYDMPANDANPSGYSISSTNKLITNGGEPNHYYEYASGIKTGSIDYYYPADGSKVEGSCSLVSTAHKGQYTYMLVTLSAPYKFRASEDEARDPLKYAYEDHTMLYKWAFSTFEYKCVLSVDRQITKIDVEQGENADHVILKPLSPYSTLLPNTLDDSAIQLVPTAEKSVVAPVEKGQILGTVDLILAGEKLATIDLISADGVERSQIAYMVEQIKLIVDTGWFKACAVILVVLIIMLIVLISVRKAQRANAKNRNKRIRR